MPKYLIEREIPGVGKMSPAELKATSEKSNGVLKELGPKIQWVHSYVTDNKIYCIYYAPSPALLEEHAKCLGVPLTRVERIRTMIDPTTPEA
jgi:hypothetical protein